MEITLLYVSALLKLFFVIKILSYLKLKKVNHWKQTNKIINMPEVAQPTRKTPVARTQVSCLSSVLIRKIWERFGYLWFFKAAIL